MVKQRKGVKEELIVPIKNVEGKSNIPTPEQMRIAQILEKKVVDSTIKLKIKQIMDATQRSADEVYVALHDSDFDENRAVDLLIEGEGQLAHWCTNEKRKKKLVELKEKKEQVPEPEVPQPEKKDPFRGRGDNKSRPGRRQVGGRQPQKPLPGQPDEPRKPPASSESRAPRGKRPGSSGFGSLVFERSNPPPVDPGFLAPVKNQWEKPLLRTSNGPEDDWDCEEFQGSLSQTQIFTSSKRHEPQEMAEEVKTPKPPSRPALLSSLTFTNKAHDPPGLVSPTTPQKRDSAVELRPNVISSQERPTVIPSQDRPGIMPSQDRPGVIPSQDKLSVQPSQDRPHIPSEDRPSLPLPTETRTEYVYRLNYAKVHHHEDKRPPSKIPTLPVEMPPELKPSLSFLDIQFGAMDLCPSEANSESQSNLSIAPSQNSSATTLMPPSSLPSSCSATHLMANTSISSSTTNDVTSNVANCSPLSSTTCSNSSGMCSIANPLGMSSISSPPGMNNANSPSGLNTIANSITTISSINSCDLTTGVNQSLNSIASTAVNSMADSSNSIANTSMNTMSAPPVNMVPPCSISHLMGQNSIQQTGGNIAQPNSVPNASHMVPNTIGHTYESSNNQRFMSSSQTFNNSHLQYGIINPPGYESRDNPPPPHLPQPHTHLPPFKSPPGVPKGAMVPNLPPGSLMSNPYIVGQGNVPYFPHPPIYYYEEVPPVMNSQQRLTSMTSHPNHYDVTYQTAPSSRDSVHYNV